MFYGALAGYVVWVAYLFAKVRFELIPQAGEDDEKAGLGTRRG
jgi:hypothetical protein